MSQACWQAHRARVQALSTALAESSGPVRLKKSTSNLFRVRLQADHTALDVTDLNHVIEIDVERRFVDAEGMITYADLVDATLPHGLAPAIVPELKSITVGGATTGVGIESGGFRHGLVHDGVLELDVLVADGSIRTCSPKRDAGLFYGFPNSYGSLGYATRVRLALIPVQPYVRLEHQSFSEPEALFAAVEKECAEPGCDYLDGVYFSPNEFVLTRAVGVDELPDGATASDYTWMQQYWRSLRQRFEDYLSIHDYLWRWDTDWFWCSKNVGAQVAPLRFLLGRKRLNSVTYQKIMRASHRWPLKLVQYFRPRTESVIQDVDIPIANAAAFLADFERDIGIRPVWICPFIVPSDQFSLFKLRTDTPYINFGFWDMVRSSQPDGHYNARVEALVARHGGKKSLYSRSTYDEETFWSEYNRQDYAALKEQWDPDGRFPGLYEKAVGRG